MDASVVARAAERAPSSPAPGGTGRASAKAILFGEHAVVYGEPAIAVPLTALGARAEATLTDEPSRLRSAVYTGPIDRAPDRIRPTVTAITATLEALGDEGQGVLVRVESDIPTERGLGSSAGVASAIVDAVAAALGADPDEDARFELVQTSERAAHGNPSGLDARTVRARGPVWLHRGKMEQVSIAAPLHLVIADSGVHGRTRAAIADVRARRDALPDETDALIRSLGSLVVDARAQLGAGDVAAFGAGMDAAHGILTTIGVGHPALDRLASAARSAGALGAKLTGGGQGGCLLALATDPDGAARIAASLRAAGAAATWTTTVEATP